MASRQWRQWYRSHYRRCYRCYISSQSRLQCLQPGHNTVQWRRYWEGCRPCQKLWERIHHHGRGQRRLERSEKDRSGTCRKRCWSPASPAWRRWLRWLDMWERIWDRRPARQCRVLLRLGIRWDRGCQPSNHRQQKTEAVESAQIMEWSWKEQDIQWDADQHPWQ